LAPLIGTRMNLHGSVSDNLRAAIRSAERLRGRAVHPDTLAFWQDLLRHARRADTHPGKGGQRALDDLIVELERLVAERTPDIAP
jgi:hypothetical protein